MAPTLEDRARANRLKVALEEIAELMPNGRVRDEVVQHVTAAILTYEGELAAETCRRCRRTFQYAAEFFQTRGLQTPRHCSTCRAARREERERANAASYR
jgi:hypothetical protein